jgi:hypothetical protein
MTLLLMAAGVLSASCQPGESMQTSSSAQGSVVGGTELYYDSEEILVQRKR